MDSDGGGFAEFPFEWVPVIAAAVAVFALLVNVVLTVANWWRADSRDARDAVNGALAHLLSSEVVAARDVVARAARRGQGIQGQIRSQEEFAARIKEEDQFCESTRKSCFVAMWSIQATQPQLVRHLKGKTLQAPEAEALYWHLSLMCRDLGRALERWGSRFDWREAGQQTASALDAMPTVAGQGVHLTVRSEVERLRAVIADAEQRLEERRARNEEAEHRRAPEDAVPSEDDDDESEDQ